jgi:hypothetical protein
VAESTRKYAMSFTTGKVRVLIATTNGPVEVQLLTEEDAAIGRCVACIGGTTETADIASAYHAFVVRPTGVIEGRFGHSCYRLDVSGRIDAGSSWQLGVLAAHALLAAGRLAQENDIADAILWATGSVRPVDLTVGGVSHVPEKLQNSLPRLQQECDAKRPILLAIPAANAADGSNETTTELQKLGAEFVTVAHAQALFDALGLKLSGVPEKAPAAIPTATTDPVLAAPAKLRRAIIPAVAAAMLIIIAIGAAAVFTGVPFNFKSGATLPQQTAETTSTPNVTPATKTASQTDSRSVEPKRPELVPETIPFIPASDRERIRDQYMTAPGYKALAMTLWDSHFVTGLPSQDAADKAAIEICDINKHRPSTDTSIDVEYRCELFASGTAVVTQRTSIPMPPMPWVNATLQRPFMASEAPMASSEYVNNADRRYGRHQRSKALVVAPNGRYFSTSGQISPEEAMRRSLERCGFVSNAACLVVAVDDMFVNAIPTLAKAVGFYRPDALFGVQPGEREDIARRLAATHGGWQAVALGATRHAGVKVGAISERSAVDGALENCALYDHDCRVEVIGPFLVQPPTVPAPSPAPAAHSAAPPASRPAAEIASPRRPASPSTSTAPPTAIPPDLDVHTTKQTTFER